MRRSSLNRLSSPRAGFGPPLPGVAAKIVNPETLVPLPVGEEGLLLIYGPNAMRGYLHKPELTAQAIRDAFFPSAAGLRFELLPQGLSAGVTAATLDAEGTKTDLKPGGDTRPILLGWPARANVTLNDIDLLNRDRFTEGIPHEWFTYLRKNAPIHHHSEPDGPGFCQPDPQPRCGRWSAIRK